MQLSLCTPAFYQDGIFLQCVMMCVCESVHVSPKMVPHSGVHMLTVPCTADFSCLTLLLMFDYHRLRSDELWLYYCY